jgi:hypothetical protein
MIDLQSRLPLQSALIDRRFFRNRLELFVDLTRLADFAVERWVLRERRLGVLAVRIGGMRQDRRAVDPHARHAGWSQSWVFNMHRRFGLPLHIILVRDGWLRIVRQRERLAGRFDRLIA